MEIQDRVIRIFSEVFNLNEGDIKLTDNKEDIESWDSIGHLSCVMRLEEEFNIRLSTDDIIKIDSIENCIKVINELLKSN